MYDPKKSSRFSLVTVKRQVRHHTSDLTSMCKNCYDRWTGWNRDNKGKTTGKYSSFLAAWRYGPLRGQADYGNTWAAPGPAQNRVIGKAIMKISFNTLSPPPPSSGWEDQSELSLDQKIFPNHLKYNYSTSTAGMERAWILNRDYRELQNWRCKKLMPSTVSSN